MSLWNEFPCCELFTARSKPIWNPESLNCLGRASFHLYVLLWWYDSSLLQIRKRRNGEVVKEFRTSRAAAYLETNVAGIQYAVTQERKSITTDTSGNIECLRNHKEPKNSWLVREFAFSGSLTAIVSKANLKLSTPRQEDEIAFDCGKVEHYNLDDITYEWKNDQGQKPVEQLDLKTGRVLASFSSVSDACRAVGMNSDQGGIALVCGGNCRSVGGFFWRYKGSDVLPRKMKGRRKVEQLCLDSGRTIATFDSIVTAGKAVGITTPGISYCCNGRYHSKSAGGFGWRFAVDG